MKKALCITLLLLFSNSNVYAFWWGNNNVYNGWDNNWPIWTPMYWMDEFAGNNNVNNYYGLWGGHSINNRPFETNPWSHTFNYNLEPSEQVYFPYTDSVPNAGYSATYYNAYRPLPGFQNMPLVPSKGPTAFNP